MCYQPIYQILKLRPREANVITQGRQPAIALTYLKLISPQPQLGNGLITYGVYAQ